MSEVIVTSTTGLRQQVKAGAHEFAVDEPRPAGGDDAGPNPYDLLLAALGSCTSMTLLMYARHKGIALEKVTVRLRHDRVHAADCQDCMTREGHITQISREIELSGPLTAEQRQRLLEIAARCPVHKTLSAEIKVRDRLLP